MKWSRFETQFDARVHTRIHCGAFHRDQTMANFLSDNLNSRHLAIAVGIILLAISPGHALAENWKDKYTSGQFEIVSEFDLSTSKSDLDELDTLKKDIAATLNLKIPKGKIEVLLFANRWSFRNYIANRIPEAVDRRALYVQGDELTRIYAYRNPYLKTDLRHEATHALLHQALPYVPMWLDEGIAEYFEVPAKKRYRGHHHLRSIQIVRNFRWRPSVTKLEAKSDLTEMDGDDYRDSWAWVHFMLHGPDESRAVLATFFKQVQAGKLADPISDGMKQAFSHPEAALDSHLRNLR